jgi:predicted DNA-binding transcriptional regulator YafY
MTRTTTDTIARQWEMLKLIPRAPRKVSARQLHEKLETLGFPTTARTVERDLHTLSMRFPLEADDGKPRGWAWSREANIEFAPRLSPQQGVALLLSLAHLRNFMPQSLLTEMVPVFAAAEQEVAASGWKDWHRRTAILPTNMPLLAPNIGADVLDDVHASLALRRCLSGRYRSRGSSTARELTIHPLGLIVRGSVQYLVCTLRDYQDIRQIALHRLSHTRLLETPRRQPAGFDFGRYVASAASKYWAQGKIRLVARFTTEAAGHLRDTPVSRDQTIVELGGGEWVQVTATVESDETLRWWLLGFGSRVEVVEPAELREELQAELAQAANRYTSSRRVEPKKSP